MKKIISIIKFDITNALRDSMVIYILIAPILLAGVLRLFLPSFEGSVVTLAVQAPEAPEAPEAPPAPDALRTEAAAFANDLESYARVERYDSAAEVRRRVLATDDVGGFVYSDGDDGQWRILLEGNESVEVMQSLYRAATDGIAGTYTITEAGDRSPIKEYVSVGLVMLASLIGGLAVSFAMIDEKEQSVTRAFTTTPLSVAHYFAARGIVAAVIGFLVAVVGHVVLVGAGVPFGKFLIALGVSAPLSLVVALLVGGIAKNQIQAVAALKVVMLVYLTVPFVSIAVPRAWHRLFYVFPNYWMFRSFENLYVSGARTGDLPLSATVTAASGIAALIVLGISLGKHLKPQRG